MSKSIFLAAFYLGSVALPVFAQPTEVSVTDSPLTNFEVNQAKENNDRMVARLEAIRHRIETEENNLRVFRTKQEEAQKSLQRIVTELEQLQYQKTEQGTAAQAIEIGLGELELAVGRAAETMNVAQQRLKARVVAIYKMHNRGSALNYLVLSQSVTDFMRRIGYLKRLAHFDRSQISEMKEAQSSFQGKRLSLLEKKEEHEKVLQEISKLEARFVGKRKTQSALVDEVKRKKEKTAVSIEKLKKEAEELETILSGLMGGAEPTPSPKLPPKQPEVDQTKIPEKEPPVEPGFQGKGLAQLRGKLSYPIVGEVVRRFGKQRHDEFVDTLFIKGLEFHASPGNKVTAVAVGKVVFNSVLPGYGNVVILDHGSRYYTLYGRLAASLPRVGELVQAGNGVGVVGEPDDKGRNFYFELRLNGKPTDPMEYLK